MIKLSSISKSFGKRTVLKDVSFEIEKGELSFIAGSSGSGKTTLMKIMFREIYPSEGDGTVAGFELSKVTPRKLHIFRRKVGFVFQDSRLIANRTVFENISFVLRVLGYKKAERQKKAEDVLRTVGLEKQMDLFPSYLSGGEQQKVAIARAIVNDPELVLADEPVGSLDSDRAIEIMDVFYGIVSKGTTVVIATHDFDIVRFMKKNTILLSNGVAKKL